MVVALCLIALAQGTMSASAGPPAGFTYVAADSAVATPGDGVGEG